MTKLSKRELRLARRAATWEAGLGRRARIHAWFDMLFFDHGFLRLCYRNRHRVSERLWRSAQPTPRDLKDLKRQGLKSVVCVRAGRAFGSWPLEKEACWRLKLDLRKVAIRARQAPSKHDLLALIDLLTSLSYPALIHCKSGADRTGFVTAVYLIAIEHRPVEDALGQLALRFGHLRSSRAGILREVIERFRHSNDSDFRSWVEAQYLPEDIALTFRARSRVAAVRDLLIRLRAV